MSNARSEVLQDSNVSGWQQNGLDLVNGARYLVSLTVVNGAGLSATSETDGVTVDITPPVMMSVTVFNTATNMPALDSLGYLTVTQSQSLSASWQAHDSESGIDTYHVSVVELPSGKPVTSGQDGFVDFGSSTRGAINGLNLQVSDVTTGPFYQVVVKARNRAGLTSANHTSQPIR